jgi:hypothetical protein
VSALLPATGVDSPLLGMINRVVPGCESVAVKIKNAMSRNPRSTIGVMSILREWCFRADACVGCGVIVAIMYCLL